YIFELHPFLDRLLRCARRICDLIARPLNSCHALYWVPLFRRVGRLGRSSKSWMIVRIMKRRWTKVILADPPMSYAVLIWNSRSILTRSWLCRTTRGGMLDCC